MEVAQQLDYSKMPKVCPYYGVSKILPRTNQSFTMFAETESIFEIPPVVFNLAPSTLSFTASYPTHAANQPQENDPAKVNWVPADCFPYIKQIQLMTRGDVKVCDLNEVSNYTKIIYPATTAQSEIEPKALANTLVQSGSYNGGLVMSNVAANTNYKPIGGAGKVATYEYRRLFGADAAGAKPLFRVNLKLNKLRDTIFSLNKDLFFNETMFLRIVWNTASRTYFLATAANDPATGAVVPRSGIAISDLALYLKVEKNPNIIQSINESVASGKYTMLIPYTRGYKLGFNNVAAQNVNYKFNRTDGAKLLKIWHSPFSAADTTNTMYDNSALNGAGAENAKVKSFHTEVNNDRLQPFEITTNKYEDHMLLQDRLKGSCILDSDIYHSNWFWVDTFDGPGVKLHDEPNYNELCGLSLDNEIKWDFVSDCTQQSLNHFTFAVFLKYLTVTPEGVFVS